MLTDRPPTSAEIVAKWRAGDRAKARSLLTTLAVNARHSTESCNEVVRAVKELGLARRTAADVLLDVADIDDAEQSALIVVSKKIDQFEGRSEFTAWLRTVVKNEARQLLRRKNHGREQGLDGIAADQWTHRVSSLIASQEDLNKAIADLPDEFRLPLQLKAEHGLGYQEIATQLEVPIGTIRSRISRARERVMLALHVDTD